MLAGDSTAAVAGMTEDVVLVSPMTDRFAFNGPAAVAQVLDDALSLMKHLRYTESLVVGDRAILRGHAIVAGESIDEILLFHLSDEDLIEQLTLFMRPIPAATTFLRLLAPVIARRERGRATALGASRLTGAARLAVHAADAASASVFTDHATIRPRPL
ncbi:MAG: hypothetical protein REI11_18120 [Patulibacter sp.]|nr:hypothetical protein [Patulibacter sp.]